LQEISSPPSTARRNAGRADRHAAFTEGVLTQLNITNFDDYVKYLPNVSREQRPGQSEIYMRA